MGAQAWWTLAWLKVSISEFSCSDSREGSWAARIHFRVLTGPKASRLVSSLLLWNRSKFLVLTGKALISGCSTQKRSELKDNSWPLRGRVTRRKSSYMVNRNAAIAWIFSRLSSEVKFSSQSLFNLSELKVAQWESFLERYPWHKASNCFEIIAFLSVRLIYLYMLITSMKACLFHWHRAVFGPQMSFWREMISSNRGFQF